MRSLQSIAVDKILQAARDVRNKAQKTDDLTRLDEKRKQNRKKYKLPTFVSAFLHPKKYVAASTDCYEIGSGSKCVLYLHGGSYVDQPMIFHWRFLQKLARETDVTVVMPIYAKAPNKTCDTVVPQMAAIYKSLCKRFSAENMTIMGDSAGGGMVLALCQLLAQNKVKQPAVAVLMSPWLDVNTDNPEIEKYIGGDISLDVKDLRLFGGAYRGKNDKTCYLASPIYGDLRNLAPVRVFIGSCELFLPDCLKLKHLANECGADVEVYEYAFMQHVFPFMPIPEALEARKQIIGIIEEFAPQVTRSGTEKSAKTRGKV
ncbi:MAG: alpha/beta hydrolase [Corallococcus sp.]|nr:alpha/beta hydrolase [Corallococcus sp.]